MRYLTITGWTPGTVDAAPRLQVVPLVLSSVLLGSLVFSVFGGPDQSPTVTCMGLLVMFLVSFLTFVIHLYAGVIAMSAYDEDEVPQGKPVVEPMTRTRDPYLFLANHGSRGPSY